MNDSIGSTAAEVGERIDNAARGLHEIADELRSKGGYVFSGLADEIAYKADGISAYLRECDTGKLMSDAERLAERAPLASAAVALLGGFLASRFVKARPLQRTEPLGSPDADGDGQATRQSALKRHPLAVTLGAASAGMLLGLFVPPTQLETERLPAALEAAAEKGRRYERAGSGNAAEYRNGSAETVNGAAF
ncbi:MAG: hypothetical protein GIW95_11015 [Candidatus Eremiobacteraeota bacterium]|nr:hypothetical protein [Candidatus Eremiobacteraeota bacterium]